MSVYLWYIIPLFVAYQIIEHNQKNTLIDLSEFLIGYGTAYIFGGYVNNGLRIILKACRL